MRDKNPADNNVISKDKSWNSSVSDAMLSFVNRDSIISEHIPAPQVVYPLGRVYQNAFAAGNAQDLSDAISNRAIWYTNSSSAETSIPGIMTLHFDPIFGQGGETVVGLNQGVSDIYINKWTQLRILNNMTQQFQPGDLQAVTCQLMNLKMHVENIRRALRIMQTVTMSSTSGYHSPEALIAAAGWPMSEQDMRLKFYAWRDYFNRSIVGNLNNVVWLKDIVPGFNRWEGLVTEIYKDTSADTDYCQLFMLRPNDFWQLKAVQSDQGVTSWQMFKYMFTEASPLWTMTPAESATWTSSDAVDAFQRYLGLVASEIRGTFYDDSVMNILATLNAIEERNMSSQIAVYRENIPYLDIEPEEIKFTWNFKMMLAIHNATIMRVDLSNAVVNARTGAMQQTYNIVVTSDTEGSTLNGFFLGSTGKALNLPCFGTTNADFANATQWTIAPCNVAADGAYKPLRWYNFGTEIIQSAWIWKFHRSAVPGDDHVFSRAYYYQQWVPGNTEVLDHTWVDGDTRISIFNSISDVSSFAFAPLQYDIINVRDASTADEHYETTRLVGQLEVLYAPTQEVLNHIHEQWVYNFWGYPVAPASIGTPSFECANT